MRPTLLLALCIAATSASAQTWNTLNFGQSRDSVQSQLTNQNIPVESTPDGSLQTNSDYPVTVPGLAYPLPMMVTMHFDAASHLAGISLALDLPAMRHDWPSLGSDEALYNFAADKLSLALAGNYGAPIFTTPSCTAEAAPCTLEWRNTLQVIQLERIPTGRHLYITYLPFAPTL
jgi:hypothetical protein